MSHLPLSATLGSAVSDRSMQLHTGSTNRFIEMATIRFCLPAPAHTVLRVFDQNGHNVCIKSGQFETGDNHFLLHRSDLPEPGLYLYRIESVYGNGVRKIMLY